MTDKSVQKNRWLRSTTFARMGSANRQLGKFDQVRQDYRKAADRTKLRWSDFMPHVVAEAPNRQHDEKRSVISASAGKTACLADPFPLVCYQNLFSLIEA